MDPVEAGRKLKEQLDPPWHDLRAARVQRRVIEGLAAPRPRRNPALAAALVAALVAVSVGAWVAVRRAPAPAGVELADGSTAVPVGDGRVVIDSSSPERVEISQPSGEVLYEVTRRPGRSFMVAAGDVQIRVVGTAFSVRRGGGTVRVEVKRGVVEVSQAGRVTSLRAGESVSLAEAPGEPPRPAAPPASLDAPPGLPPAPSGSPPASSAAPAEPPPAPPPAPAPSGAAVALPPPAEIFRMVDDARARGDAEEAIRLLQRLIQGYPKDSRVGLAQFTIGRLDMQQGRPAAAAAAFSRCGDGFHGEALAEAALAWAAAGQRAKASSAADRYLLRFPDGPRAREMRGLSN